jgi:hypothetical protein
MAGVAATSKSNLLVFGADLLCPILDKPPAALPDEIPDVHPNLLGE